MDSEPKRGRGAFDGWSKSSLKSLLEGCSWQWALQRIGGLPGGSTPHSAAGTGMHAAIELHERTRIGNGTVPDEGTLYEEAAREAWRDGAAIPSQWHGVHGDQRQAAEWALDLTATWLASDTRRTLMGYAPISVEPHVETPNVPVEDTLRGYLDWFGWDHAAGEYVVVDYKSATNLRRWGNADHHTIEAATYLYLAIAGGLVPEGFGVRMEWHVISRKGEDTVLVGPSFGQDIVEFVNARLIEADRIKQTGGYKTNPSWGLCNDRWCAFYHGCQVTGQLSPDSLDFTRGSVEADSLPAPEPAPGGGPLSAAPGATPTLTDPAGHDSLADSTTTHE